MLAILCRLSDTRNGAAAADLTCLDHAYFVTETGR